MAKVTVKSGHISAQRVTILIRTAQGTHPVTVPARNLSFRATLILARVCALTYRAKLFLQNRVKTLMEICTRDREATMKRLVLMCALLLAAGPALAAQQAGQSGPYTGVSNPPPDDTITTPKPPAGHYADDESPASAPVAAPVQPSQAAQDNELPQPITDSGAAPDTGTVQVAPDAALQPAANADNEPVLNSRAYMGDPDGDIVHPEAKPGELVEGTTIRARLLNRLSTADSQSGDPFRATVAYDVFQGDRILIPAGAQIEGIVVRASSGHAGGHGSMLLRPQSVTLADGQRFKMFAQVSDTLGSKTNVTGEGVITPDSQLKKDGIEYGGAVGAGVVTGAILGGPAGALAGTIVGASAVTVHLLMSHPQATLDSGTVLVFTLTEPLDLVAAGPSSGS